MSWGVWPAPRRESVARRSGERSQREWCAPLGDHRRWRCGAARRRRPGARRSRPRRPPLLASGQHDGATGLRLPRPGHAHRRHLHRVPRRLQELSGHDLLVVPRAGPGHVHALLAELRLQPGVPPLGRGAEAVQHRRSRTARTRISGPRPPASAATRRASASPIRGRARTTRAGPRVHRSAAPATHRSRSTSARSRAPAATPTPTAFHRTRPRAPASRSAAPATP